MNKARDKASFITSFNMERDIFLISSSLI